MNIDTAPAPIVTADLVGMTAGQLRTSARNFEFFALAARYPGQVASLRNEARARQRTADALDASNYAAVPHGFEPERYL